MSKRFPVGRLVLAGVVLMLGLVILIVRLTHHGGPSGFGPPGGRSPGGPPRAGGPAGGAPTPVAVASASTGSIQVRVPALGTVTPLATVVVRTQISGILQRILFTEGQLAHEGEPLALVDPRPYEAAVRQMAGNLRRDQALLADARLDLERYENLVKEDSIAVQQLDTQRALVDQYAGTVESDQGQLETAKVNLIYTHIAAPVTGRVGLRQVDQGNYVTPGDANGIVVINQLQPITVVFPVPEDNVPELLQRLRQAGPPRVDVFDRANSQNLAQGRLLTLDNQIDATTGTVKLRALFDNKDGALFPNQFVNVQLLEKVLDEQVIVPTAAVRRGAPNGTVTTFVYVVKPDETVEVRPIQLGIVDGERAAVSTGLAPGERVVTEGGDRLREGAKVTLPQAARPPPDAAGRGSSGSRPSQEHRPAGGAAPSDHP